MEKQSRGGNNKRKNIGNRSANAQQTQKKNGKQNEQSKLKKVGLNARNDKAKYSDDEIARARYIDSKAKFLVRDRIHNDNIDTKNKWIDITNLEVKDRWDRKGNYDPEILSFDAEIYDRTEQPVYEEGIDKTYEMPKSAITYRKPRRISEAKRE